LEKFQNFQVIAFDIKIFGPVKIQALGPGGPENSLGRSFGSQPGLPAARPEKAVGLGRLGLGVFG
jgi:hypothetical protein